MNWFLNKVMHWYERNGCYKANPCDYMAHAWLKPVGKFLTALGSECRCCSGARVLGALVVGLVAGRML